MDKLANWWMNWINWCFHWFCTNTISHKHKSMTCLSIKYSWLHINHTSRVWDRIFFLMGMYVECKNIKRSAEFKCLIQRPGKMTKTHRTGFRRLFTPLTACLLVSFFMRASCKFWLLHVIWLLEIHPTVDLHSSISGEVLLTQKYAISRFTSGCNSLSDNRNTLQTYTTQTADACMWMT